MVYGILRLMPMAVVVLKTSSTLRGSEVGLCKAGDLLLIDNEKVLHGRLSYEGERSMAVALASD